jgi:cystathionine gamma-synthase
MAHWQTDMIHGGSGTEASGAVTPSISMSTTYVRAQDQESFDSGYIYSRYGHPNRTDLELKLAKLEFGAVAYTYSSGMTAIMALIHSLGPGSHIIIPDDVYFGVLSQLNSLYIQWGISYTAVDFTNLDALNTAIKPQTKLIWIESPSNPALKITDISAVVAIAKKHNILTGVDNTWATPFHTNPLLLGADVAMHSTTKYLGGHSDHLGGVLVLKEKGPLADFLYVYQKAGGGVMAPFECWLLNRSLASFAARMAVHNLNASHLATYLSTHPAIECVLYPGLPSDAGHIVAQKQMQNGYGGMLSILVKGNKALALAICSKLKLFKHATSLGGVESLIEHRKSIEGPTSATPENLLRISVGLEHHADLVADFHQALA